MQLILINGLVFATHQDEQAIPKDAYPDSTVMWVPDDAIVIPGEAPPVLAGEALAHAIEHESFRRIVAQGLTGDARMAILEHVMAIELTAGNNPQGQDAADVAAAVAIYTWIKEVMTATGSLISGASQTFRDDANWPVWDANNGGWSAFIRRVVP